MIVCHADKGRVGKVVGPISELVGFWILRFGKYNDGRLIADGSASFEGCVMPASYSRRPGDWYSSRWGYVSLSCNYLVPMVSSE